MSIVLLSSTTALSRGFFQLIGKGMVGYLPLSICGLIILYNIRILYRDTTTRNRRILPYIQEQGLGLLTGIGAAWGLHYWVIDSRSTIIIVGINLYAGLILRSTIQNNQTIKSHSIFGYIAITAIAYILSRTEPSIIIPSTIVWIITGHRIIGLLCAHYLQGPYPLQTKEIYSYLGYVGYISMILLSYELLPFLIASIVITIIIGRIAISLPTTTEIEDTDHITTITAEDILEGHNIFDPKHKIKEIPINTRLYNMGIQPAHGTFLIRIIIGVLVVTIIYEMYMGISAPSIPIVNSIGFIILTALNITISAMYYLSHRKKDTITIRKVAVIIISNIAIGITIVHVFYPHIWAIIAGSILRNMINSVGLQWIYRNTRYHTILLPYEYYYWTVANTIITILNSILIMTRVHSHTRQTIIIILCLYRGAQGVLSYDIYKKHIIDINKNKDISDILK